MSDQWQTSACILCECNCGIKVQTGGEVALPPFDAGSPDKVHI